jgi:predicted phage-related endonuclease
MEDMHRDVCAVHPEYLICRASLDGISHDGKRVLEIKCPRGLETLNAARAGKVIDHYWPQVQFQLAVTGADSLDFFVFHEESKEDALVQVMPDVAYQGKLIAAVLEFWALYVATDLPPPLTERDVKEIPITHDEIAVLSDLIKKGKDTLTKAELDQLKARAVNLAGHPKIRCGDVQISTVLRKGEFSYHKLTIRKEGA